MPNLELPAPIRDELHVVNAKRISEWDGPNGDSISFGLRAAGL
jgi:hypothetical protein